MITLIKEIFILILILIIHYFSKKWFEESEQNRKSNFNKTLDNDNIYKSQSAKYRSAKYGSLFIIVLLIVIIIYDFFIEFLKFG
jgi:hypothetical protein